MKNKTELKLYNLINFHSLLLSNNSLNLTKYNIIQLLKINYLLKHNKKDSK